MQVICSEWLLSTSNWLRFDSEMMGSGGAGKFKFSKIVILVVHI